jgi:hypothetical protein
MSAIVYQTAYQLGDAKWLIRLKGDWLQIVDDQGRERHRSHGHMMSGCYMASQIGAVAFQSSGNVDEALKQRAATFVEGDTILDAQPDERGPTTVSEMEAYCKGMLAKIADIRAMKAADMRVRVENALDALSAEAQAIEDKYHAADYRGDLDADEGQVETIHACCRKIRAALSS